MEELLKRLGIDENAGAEEIVGKLGLKKSEIAGRLSSVEDEKEKQKLEEELKQIDAAVTAFSWMKGKTQAGIAREEDEKSEDFSDLKGQSAETAPAEGQNGKTEKELYVEAFDMIGTPDYAKGVEMMQRLAESGYPEAQNQMGFMYMNGNGVAQDYLKAVEWFGKAAEQGDALAQINLGERYRAGEGIAQDYLKAAMWYQKAADQGDSYAQYEVL